MAGNSARSSRYTVVFTTSSRPRPAADRTAARLSSARLSSTAMPPGTRRPFAGSSPTWPEQKTRSPAATACAYGPMARGAAALAIAFQHLRAFERVHRHPPPAGDETRDALARQRAAALPEPDQHVLDARHLHAALRLSSDQPEQALQPPLALLAPPLELLGRQDAREHALRGDLSVPDAGEQRLLIALGELARDAFERAVLAEPGGIEMVAGEIPVEDLPPGGDRPRALLRLDVGTDAS